MIKNPCYENGICERFIVAVIEKYLTFNFSSFVQQYKSRISSNSVLIFSRKVEYTAKEAIKRMFRIRAFYLVWVSVFLGDSGLQFVLNLYKVHSHPLSKKNCFRRLAVICLLRTKIKLFSQSLNHQASKVMIVFRNCDKGFELPQ